MDAPGLPDGRSPALTLGAEGISLLTSTLQDQFGLRLTSGAGAVRRWVSTASSPLRKTDPACGASSAMILFN